MNTDIVKPAKKPTPDEVLANLKSKFGKRAHPNFDNVHEVCRAISAEPGAPERKDYSIATIGRRLEQLGRSPGYNTLNSPGGAHFRELIRAWAEDAGATMVKLPAKAAPKGDDDWLHKITDPDVRSEFSFRLAELRSTKAQLNTLLSKTNVPIDMRPKDGLPHAQGSAIRVLPPEGTKLLEHELEALRGALDERNRKRRHLEVGPEDQVAHKNETIFDPGFASGFAKLLKWYTTG